jgi:hypothetical protein
MDSIPRTVRITDVVSGEAFHERLRLREAGLNGNREENEVVILELHTSAGEIIRVRDVGYYRDSDTLLFDGFDRNGNVCQVIAKVQGLQVMFRVIKIEDPQRDEDPQQERKRIGFYVDEEQETPGGTEQKDGA